MDFLSLFYQALASPAGIVVLVEEGDRELARSKFYSARRESGDESLKSISIAFSPTDPCELWLVKKGAAHGPPQVADTLEEGDIEFEP